jgi:hypothetical protein
VTTVELGEAAWELVEYCRSALSVPERHAAFGHLGLSEYNEAMVVTLRSVVRTGGPALTPATLARLHHLQQVHYLDREFCELLAVAPRQDRVPPSPAA